VLRDWIRRDTAAQDLVPGDRVFLRRGAIVRAELELVGGG